MAKTEEAGVGGGGEGVGKQSAAGHKGLCAVLRGPGIEEIVQDQISGGPTIGIPVKTSEYTLPCSNSRLWMKD